MFKLMSEHYLPNYSQEAEAKKTQHHCSNRTIGYKPGCGGEDPNARLKHFLAI